MRDAKGHFAKSSPTAKFLNGLVSSSSNVSNDQTLVDIHVNNPLHKIVELLQDIKTQKAFSFTLKGSVGLAGIAVAFAVVGVFGSNKILCDKGVQSVAGTVRILQVGEPSSQSQPLLNRIKALLGIATLSKETGSKRVILITNSNTIHLVFSRQSDAAAYANLSVIATGQYNTCNQELTVAAGGLELAF